MTTVAKQDVEYAQVHVCFDCHIDLHQSQALLCESCKAHRADGHVGGICHHTKELEYLVLLLPVEAPQYG